MFGRHLTWRCHAKELRRSFNLSPARMINSSETTKYRIENEHITSFKLDFSHTLDYVNTLALSLPTDLVLASPLAAVPSLDQ